ncbi:MAG: hypothetical protein ACOCRK_07940 [bacterium]
MNFAEIVANIDDFLQFKKELKDRKEVLNNKISEADKFFRDVYHLLGLGNLDAISIMLVASELAKVSKERFAIKEERELVSMAKGVLDKHEDFFDELEYVLNQIKLKKEQYDNCKYIARSNKGKCLIEEYAEDSSNLSSSIDKDTLRKVKGKFDNSVA